jgi:hypothetical protein
MNVHNVESILSIWFSYVKTVYCGHDMGALWFGGPRLVCTDMCAILWPETPVVDNVDTV